MNILILHGIGGESGIHWQQWLHDELVKVGHTVKMPTLSESNHPSRESWLEEIEGAMDGFDSSETIIVAHSLGVPSALDYVSQLDGKLYGFVSVSGFYYPLGTELNDYFMKECEIDIASVSGKIEHKAVIFGNNDPYVPQSALSDLASELGVQPVVLKGGGHINTDSGYSKLSDALSFVERIINKKGEKS